MLQKKITLLLFCIAVKMAFAQKETFDIATFKTPTGWVKDVKENVAVFSSVNKKNSGWCQAAIYKSVTSKGSIEQDFDSEWQELIVTAYHPTATPQITDLPEINGWKIKSGGSEFIFNQKKAVAMLTVFSGYGKIISIVSATNHADYLNEIQQLITSIEMGKPDTATQMADHKVIANVAGTGNNPKGFTFSSSHFDDGWVAAEKTGWVEVSKAGIKVLLHYANAVTSRYIPNRDEATKIAWDNLIAPRYHELRNYFVFNNTLDPEAPFLVSGDAIENSTGKTVHIVLFKRGKSGLIEFICPDRNAFIKQFGIDQSKLEFYTSFESWEPLKRMANYNKFAVGAADFLGKWTNDFTGIQQYINVYSGFDAGMSTYQSRQNFEFSAGNTYKWDLTVASGMVGAIKGKTTRSTGKFSVPSGWQIKCSDISGKPVVFDAYFSCVKDGRVLWLSDSGYPGYTAFGKSN